ncbi:VOC family protein [candidate division TA06 bacterium]|nr:VOC family protein [candidate division TA06 bacterium]
MANIGKASYIFYYVKDLKKSTQFYQDLLGLKVTFQREDEIAIFDAKNNLHHLKKSSTALDFICQTYPKKFTKLKSVRINGRNQSLDTNLSDGDVVEALFARKSDLRKIAHHCVID